MRSGSLIEKFLDPSINLSPKPVLNSDGSVKHPGLDNHGMGTIFEELVRRFNEENNEEAGEHWTPRDAVKLMAKLIFLPIADQIESGTYLLYDGACGTGGMLTVAEETLKQLAAEHGKQVATHLYGQEINAETYAIAKADLLLKGEGEAADNIVGGPEHSTLSNDAFPSREFDFMLSNPPYGKSWKSDLERMGGKDGIKDPRFVIEHAGDPEYSLVTRSSDGQMLFLVNMLSKMKHDTQAGQPHRRGAQRLVAVHRRRRPGREQHPPLDHRERLAGGHRRPAAEHVLQHRHRHLHLGAHATASPSTAAARCSSSTPRSGSSRCARTWARRTASCRRKTSSASATPSSTFEETEQSKIFPNAAFGYWKVTVERPLRLQGIDPNRAYTPEGDQGAQGAAGERERDRRRHRTIHRRCDSPIRCVADSRRGRDCPIGERPPIGSAVDAVSQPQARPPTIARSGLPVVEYEPDPDLRDTEQVPLLEEGGIEAFLRREVLPHVPDAWYRSRQRQDRLRDQLHPLLLQAAAVAHAGGNPRRHPGAGEGDRGAAGRRSSVGRSRAEAEARSRYQTPPPRAGCRSPNCGS